MMPQYTGAKPFQVFNFGYEEVVIKSVKLFQFSEYVFMALLVIQSLLI